MAPEVIQKLGHNTLSDIWGLGVLLCEMIGGFTPFIDQSPNKMYENIKLCRIKWPKNIDHVAKDLVSKMLVVDQDMRISIKDIKRHRFFSVTGAYNLSIGHRLEIA